MKYWIWGILSIAASAYLGYSLYQEDREVFLPGITTHGHHQIELACETCHTEFMGVKNDACTGCHAEELKLANDSHPKVKFTDPRNADLMLRLNAQECVTCHTEHRDEITQEMGVTLPIDYCYHCHATIAQERPSHTGMGFETCADAGCHNFHDNTALYEDFLIKHANQPDFLEHTSVPTRNLLTYLTQSEQYRGEALTVEGHDAPAAAVSDPQILEDWSQTAHAQAGVNCSACHQVDLAGSSAKQWSDHPPYQVCQDCHMAETKGFHEGRHGMRLAQQMSPMTPAQARIPMKPAAAEVELSCATCHGAHQFDTQFAAQQACEGCHNDAHTLAYEGSPHHQTWLKELSGEAPANSGVSCATCHLPRELHQAGSLQRTMVQHNQNFNLRPNEKMIRQVCMNCHGLEFAIDALADPVLVKTNFTGRPSRHIESIDMALKRVEP